MVGLFVLIVIVFWVWACTWIARKIAARAPKERQELVRKVALVGLLAMPFVDEAIGMIQFKTLCAANGIESVDVTIATGKKVRVQYGGRTFVHYTAVPIRESEVRFRDAVTGEGLIKHKNYYASGGWLMRYTGLGMGGGTPMLFDGNGCGFQARDRLFVANRITEVN